MADLFSVTAPLLIRYPDGCREVMVERLAHPAGLVYFRPFRERQEAAHAVRLVEGEVRGDGPWKVGAAVVTVLGCHGSDPAAAAEYVGWQQQRAQFPDDYPDREALRAIARALGYLP
jgi:hypothetical protein